MNAGCREKKTKRNGSDNVAIHVKYSIRWAKGKFIICYEFLYVNNDDATTNISLNLYFLLLSLSTHEKLLFTIVSENVE